MSLTATIKSKRLPGVKSLEQEKSSDLKFKEIIEKMHSPKDFCASLEELPPHVQSAFWRKLGSLEIPEESAIYEAAVEVANKLRYKGDIDDYYRYGWRDPKKLIAFFPSLGLPEAEVAFYKKSLDNGQIPMILESSEELLAKEQEAVDQIFQKTEQQKDRKINSYLAVASMAWFTLQARARAGLSYRALAKIVEDNMAAKGLTIIGPSVESVIGRGVSLKKEDEWIRKVR